MKKTINNLIKIVAGESDQVINSLSYPRLSIPLKIYPYAIKYQGKLLTKDEIKIPKRVLTYLIKENYIKVLPSISQKGNTITCLRCMNNSVEYFAKIACKRCLTTHLYCRSCLQMNRVLACESLYYWHDTSIVYTEKENINQWQGKLTKSQQHGADKAISAFSRQSDKLIWAVTGSGKTEIMFPVITQALAQGKRVCVASPRADVVKEFKLRVEPVFKNISIAALYAGSKEIHENAQFIISTTHQLLRFKRAFDLLIIDEVDAFPVITQALAQGKRVCVASPRADVVKEFKLRVEPVFKNISIAALYAGSKEIHENAQFIISTTHQLLRFKRAFDLLIIDEVDAFP